LGQLSSYNQANDRFVDQPSLDRKHDMKFDENNILLLTDGYKLSHYNQYPPGTTNVYSYLESRGGQFQHSLFFGLQYFLRRYLAGKVVTPEKIYDAKVFAANYFGGTSAKFNEEGWNHILEKHDGMLPLRIRAVPEGMMLPVKNVLITVENTDPKCYWLTNYVETLLVQTWYPITVATQSWYMKQTIKKYLEETGNVAGLDWKLHDFGFRGVSSVESAGLGGAAHLVNFLGTDTIQGSIFAQNYYDYGPSNVTGLVAGSIPASEHSTITSWGKEHELAAFRNMLTQYPTGFVACVSDSFDIFSACKDLWGDKLRSQVLSRDGVLVIRPDSGDPHVVLPRILNILGEAFGYTTNKKGYKVLHPKVRVIQGDGVEFKTLESMLSTLRINGWSADNIAFGSGGGLLQKLNRDTMKFAFKCSSVVVNGESREVFKSPITDSVKASKRGRLKLVRMGDLPVTVSEDSDGQDLLETVFENGRVIKEYDFEEVRLIADNSSRYIEHLGGVC
jgi:nicotinamide phosphoribosyltransferase